MSFCFRGFLLYYRSAFLFLFNVVDYCFREVGTGQDRGGGGSALMINGGGESQMAGLPRIDGDKLGNQTGIGSPASLRSL